MHVLMVLGKPTWSVGTLARLFVLGLPRGWSGQMITQFEMLARPDRFAQAARRADVVHWMIHRLFPPDSPLTAAGTHVVSVYHLEDDEKSASLDYLKRCKGVHVLNAAYKQEFLRRGWPEPSIACVPHPVDDPFFSVGRLRQCRPAARRGVRRIGFFAAADYNSTRKGIDLLPDILRRVRREVDCELIVSGLGWREILRSEAFRGLPVRNSIVPSYFDMPAAYDGLDAYLCVSRIEGGPMPVFEALACGVPVVSTKVGALQDYLTAGRSYCEVPHDDPQAAAEGLLQVLRDPVRAAEQCREGVQEFSGAMSLRTYQESLLKFYAQAAGNVPVPQAPARRPLVGALCRRRWRAWDHVYWAKEMWCMGERRRAVRMALKGAILNPFSSALWRVPERYRKWGR